MKLLASSLVALAVAGATVLATASVTRSTEPSARPAPAPAAVPTPAVAPAQLSLAQLTATDDPAWPVVQVWLAKAPEVQVLPAASASAGAALLKTQVSTRSIMGAVVYHTGGLLIDHGWLRVLGSGDALMTRTLPGWNETRAPRNADGSPGLLLIADDVLGGQFALNGGALEGPLGAVFYLAPDSLLWENHSQGYSAFLEWALSEHVPQFYEGMRWPGWKAEVARLNGDESLSVLPFLWARGPAIGERSRKVVPAEELQRLMDEMHKQRKHR